MKKSEIKFLVSLDKDNIPNKIEWNAEDSLNEKLSETKSISLALWDHTKMNTLRIDLWTKDMQTNDMKKFYVDCIGGLGQSILNSTGDEFMSKETNNLCEKLITHLKNNSNK
jgi:gliding motility-associated protein GldC